MVKYLSYYIFVGFYFVTNGMNTWAIEAGGDWRGFNNSTSKADPLHNLSFSVVGIVESSEFWKLLRGELHSGMFSSSMQIFVIRLRKKRILHFILYYFISSMMIHISAHLPVILSFIAYLTLKPDNIMKMRFPVCT